jgi:LysR family transcriptional regulator, regulator for metE and metH
VRDLELVLALASAGSTAGAAAALHLTQSAVSRALAQAEDRVGTVLFERGARGVAPTAAGARLVAGAGPVLAQLAELEQRVASPVAPTRVRIVCECYTAYRWLPSALAALAARMPDLRVDIAAEHTGDAVSALLDDTVQIALLTTGAVPRGREVVQRPLFADEVVFVVAATHPLAAARAIGRDDLRAYPLISSSSVRPAETRWFLGRVFGRRVPKLDVLRFPLTEAIVDAARAQMGVAVLSEWIAAAYVGAGDLVIKRAAHGPLMRPWRIAYRRAAAPAAERLHATLTAAAPRLRA